MSDSSANSSELDKDSEWALYFLQRKRGYRFIEHVAKGGYGVVATMYDDMRKTPVAIKCTADPGDMELDKWPSFRHPNVVPLLETIMLDCCAVFVMPVYRKDLWSVCGSGNFYNDPSSFGLCRVWLKDLLRGLTYLHDRSLCHLDLKLDNAFLKENGHACLGDFSLMAKVGDVNLSNLFLEHFIPPEFTPNYEQLSGNKVEDIALRGDTADLWEFGILYIDLLTNRKVSIEKNSNYEIWEYDVYPFLQKFINDIEYMKYTLAECFKRNYFTSDDMWNCHDLLKKFLNMDPGKRVSAKLALKHPFVNVSWPMLQRPPGRSPVLLEEDSKQGVRLSAVPTDFVPPEKLRTALEKLMIREESSASDIFDLSGESGSEVTDERTKPAESVNKDDVLAVAGPSGYVPLTADTTEEPKKKPLLKKRKKLRKKVKQIDNIPGGAANQMEAEKDEHKHGVKSKFQ